MQSGVVTYMGRDRSRSQEGSFIVFMPALGLDRMRGRAPQASKGHRYRENETGTEKNIACVFCPLSIDLMFGQEAPSAERSVNVGVVERGGRFGGGRQKPELKTVDVLVWF